MYRSPSTRYEQWKETVEWIEKEIKEEPRDLMVLGDCNMRDMGGWTESEVENLRNRALNGTKEEGRDLTGQEMLLLRLVEDQCLRQIVRGAMRGPYLLDVVFTNGIAPRAVEIIHNESLTDHATLLGKQLAYEAEKDEEE